MKKRVKLLVSYLAAALFFGFLYAFIGTKLGLFVPCVFRKVTGLQCPGCGITHMCLDLMRFRFGDAFRDNQAVFVMLPVAVFIGIRKIIQYIKTGKVKFTKTENAIAVFGLVALLVFGVLRNIINLM